jgi:hypothetical protein
MSPIDLLTLAKRFEHEASPKDELLFRVKRAQKVAFLASEKAKSLYEQYIETVQGV